MKSIGIWYEVNNEELPQLEIHINLWNLRKGKKNTFPFMDFGIGIPDFRKIEELDILLPFDINKSEIIDLYKYVKDPDTARLIFNEVECEVSSKDRYSVIKSDSFDNSKLLISIKSESELYSVVKCSRCQEGTILSVDFGELKKDDKFGEYKDLYFRFRINSDNIKKSLFCPVQKKNWFLESGFVETEIIDVKINQERNLSHNVCKDYRLKKYRFAIFKKIHLLVMSDSSDVIDAFETGIYECRKLEERAWDNYLENNYDVTNILAYHWKRKSKDEKGICNFSKLIRVSSASTNMKVIITYMLIVILLGTLGSGLLELIKFLFVA